MNSPRDGAVSTVDTGAVSGVDTAGVRERYRAQFGPRGSRRGAPAVAELTVAREVPGLCDQLDRLAGLLVQARSAYANLTAAARAALSARAEGESDPWWYLRDELGDPATWAPLDDPDPDPGTEPGTDAPGTGSGTGAGAAGWCR
jgi:hypothetical protein